MTDSGWQIAISLVRSGLAVSYIASTVKTYGVFLLAKDDNDDKDRWNSRMFVMASCLAHCIASILWNVWDAATIPYTDLDPHVSAGVSALLFLFVLGAVTLAVVSRAVYWRQIMTTSNLQKLKDVRTTLPWTSFWCGVPLCGGIVAVALTFAGSGVAALIVGGASIGWCVATSLIGTIWLGNNVQTHLLNTEKKDSKSAMFVCNDQIILATSIGFVTFTLAAIATLVLAALQSDATTSVQSTQLCGSAIVSLIWNVTLYRWNAVYTVYFNRVNAPLHFSDDTNSHHKTKKTAATNKDPHHNHHTSHNTASPKAAAAPQHNHHQNDNKTSAATAAASGGAEVALTVASGGGGVVAPASKDTLAVSDL